MQEWFGRNFKSIIYVSFVVPIITVAIVSISHVTIWYGISNPLSWAVYLSIGIEIAALSALAAISAQMGSKVYFPFGLVTLIQFVGNIFFAFEYIKIDSQQFLSWVELTGPILEFTGVEQGDLQSHRRFLAIFAGGMLPLISLSFLHMLVKFSDENKKISSKEPINEDIVEKPDIKEEPIQASDLVAEVSRFRPTEEDLQSLEELLNKFKPEEQKKRPTKEEQREILTQMMRESEEMGLYDEPFDNPLIKENNTPQNASEMMITNDEDIINSIPSDDEMSDWDLTPEPPTWMDEIPEPTEDDYREWDVTLTDGLDDNNVSWDETEYLLSSEKNKERLNSSIQQLEDTEDSFDEDHALDMVMNSIVEDMDVNDIEVIEPETIESSEDESQSTELNIDVVLDELPVNSDPFELDVVVRPEPTGNPNFVVKPFEDLIDGGVINDEAEKKKLVTQIEFPTPTSTLIPTNTPTETVLPTPTPTVTVLPPTQTILPTPTGTPIPTPTPTEYIDDLYMESINPPQPQTELTPINQPSFLKVGSKVILRNVGNSRRRNNR